MRRTKLTLIVLLALSLATTSCSTEHAHSRLFANKRSSRARRARQTLTHRPTSKKVWSRLPPTVPAVITNGPRDKHRVALTFDACQDNKPAGYDKGIVETLVREHAAATLFLGGRWMESHPDETRYLGSKSQFELANHSYLHPDFTKLPSESVTEEVLRPQRIMFDLTGKQGKLLRFPYGKYNQPLAEKAASLGLKVVQWEVVTGDPDPNISAADILRAVKQNTKNGSIIIMHMNGRGWHTAAALPNVISYLRGQGYELVTVSELLGEPTP